MTARRLFLLAALGLNSISPAGCSRANLDAITGIAPSDGSTSDGNATDTATTCTMSPLASGDTTRTVQVGSTTRSYLLHVPATYDGTKPTALVVDFHAITGSGARERSGSPYPAQTDPDGVVMAFPNGLSGPSGTAWNVGPCCVADADDVQFVKDLVAQVRTVACIDVSRVYAVGVSMGGGMAYYAACRTDVFAAIAPSAFDLLTENAPDCQPSHPVSVVAFRGTADNLVPYGGGRSSVVPGMSVTFLGAVGTFQKWAQIDRCVGEAGPEDDNGCSSYANCESGAEVILCTKQGGGQEFVNASFAWPVLSRHTL